jgi:isoleucyl-tRNA synthetase
VNSLPLWRNEEGVTKPSVGSVEELYKEIEKSIAAGFMTENHSKDLERKHGGRDQL